MLELDARDVGRLRDETQLDLGGGGGIVAEFAVEMPAQQQTPGRLPGEHHAPVALGAVLTALVPAAAGAGLDHHVLHRNTADRMRRRPPAADARGEYLKGVSGCGGDADGLAYGRDRDRA